MQKLDIIYNLAISRSVLLNIDVCIGIFVSKKPACFPSISCVVLVNDST